MFYLFPVDVVATFWFSNSNNILGIDAIELPVSLFRNHCISFDYDKKKIGFAAKKERKHQNKKVITDSFGHPY